jgi:hypothetical protein
VLGTSLDITKRDAERIELHFLTGGGHITKPDLLIAGFDHLAPTALRKIVRAISDQGGVGEWLISHAQKQCVSLPINLVPILQQQRALVPASAFRAPEWFDGNSRPLLFAAWPEWD